MTFSFPAAKAENGDADPPYDPKPPKTGAAGEGVLGALFSLTAGFPNEPKVETEPNFGPEPASVLAAGVGVVGLAERLPNADTIGAVGVVETALKNGESEGVLAIAPNAPCPDPSLNPGESVVFKLENAPPPVLALAEDAPKGLDVPNEPNGEAEGVVVSTFVSAGLTGVRGGVAEPPNGLEGPREPNGGGEGVVGSALISAGLLGV